MFAAIHIPAFRPPSLRALQSVIRRERGAARLDFRILPDHLKRDLGFLDGHVAPARDPLRD